MQCEVLFIRGGGKPTRAVRATATISVQDTPAKKTADVRLFVRTAKDKQANSYRIEGNVVKVFDKFLSSGKLTIRFTQPPCDVCFSKANPSQLVTFAERLTAAIEGRQLVPTRKSGASPRPPPPRQLQLSVACPADYPFMQGFAATLERLTISNCEALHRDARWRRLAALRLLDLSRNNLGEAADFARMDLSALACLQHLRLCDNAIGALPARFWLRLPVSLVELDLNTNKLTEISPALGRLVRLQSLRLHQNRLTELPRQLGALADLQLLWAAENRLSHLSASILGLRRLSNVDVSISEDESLFEPFAPDEMADSSHLGRVPSLLQIAGALLKNNPRLRASANVLPRDLRLELDATAATCDGCRRYFAPSAGVRTRGLVDLRQRAATVFTYQGAGRFVRLCGDSCSEACRRAFLAQLGVS